MKKHFYCLLLMPILFAACQKEDLPPADAVQVKFVNKTGKDIEDLVVIPAEVGFLEKGKTSEYFRFDELGQQFGYALVEAVGTIDGKRFSTSSVCQGECGTPSAPQGVWLENGYYKVSIYISEQESKALEFRVE